MNGGRKNEFKSFFLLLEVVRRHRQTTSIQHYNSYSVVGQWPTDVNTIVHADKIINETSPRAQCKSSSPLQGRLLLSQSSPRKLGVPSAEFLVFKVLVTVACMREASADLN